VRVARAAARVGRARFAQRGSQAGRRAFAAETVAFPKRPNLKLFFGGAVASAGVTYVLLKAFGKDEAKAASSTGNKGAPKIIISGAPGSGKGTQCENIVKEFGVVHISTGDILREHVKNGTDLGKQAKAFMEKGALVPDELVISMVKAKLAEPEVQKKGWLLDGFPRTPAQAKAMADVGVKANVFLQLEVPDEILVERICGRRTDPVTGKIYHLKFNPPPADAAVQNRLVHRKDDTEEALRTRLVAYHDNVNGILNFYKDIGVTVNGHGNAGFKENVARVQREIEDGIDTARQH
jgi:adenylate kinase